MRLHFISGLPRSGSTLLCNILAQNPRFAVGSTSGLVDMMLAVRNAWTHCQAIKASPNDGARLRVLKAMMSAYYADKKQDVGFDKSRVWLAHLEMVEHILGRKVKVLVPVRDMRDVLASLEAIWRQESATRQVPWEAQAYPEFQTVTGRLAQWMQPKGLAGMAYGRVHDAMHRGFGDRLYFVPYEELTTNPVNELFGIYNFLDEPQFIHNFEDIEQVTQEDDEAYGFRDLHTIESRLRPALPRWPELLGKAAEPYARLNFWQQVEE